MKANPHLLDRNKRRLKLSWLRMTPETHVLAQQMVGGDFEVEEDYGHSDWHIDSGKEISKYSGQAQLVAQACAPNASVLQP